jgi:hypothetical protein
MPAGEILDVWQALEMIGPLGPMGPDTIEDTEEFVEELVF